MDVKTGPDRTGWNDQKISGPDRCSVGLIQKIDRLTNEDQSYGLSAM